MPGPTWKLEQGQNEQRLDGWVRPTSQEPAASPHGQTAESQRADDARARHGGVWANSDSCCLTTASPACPAEATGLTKGSLCAFSDKRALLDTCLACTSRSPRPDNNRAVIARSRAATAGGLRELPP
ncbi:hypothetical protein HMPREF1318_1325, partial [Actinomyces massiliensis F0489]